MNIHRYEHNNTSDNKFTLQDKSIGGIIINLISKETTRIPQGYAVITKLVKDCYEEQDIDKKVQILYKINSLLPEIQRIKIPSLITDDYIDTALYRIEESISSIISPVYHSRMTSTIEVKYPVRVSLEMANIIAIIT